MMTPQIHHFGMIVMELEAHLSQSIWELKGDIVEDPLQQARLCMVGPVGSSETPLVELVQPIGKDSPTYRAMRDAPGWHHVCLSVHDEAHADHFAREAHMIPVTPWKPAVLFGGRAVRFFYSRQKELIEFLAH